MFGFFQKSQASSLRPTEAVELARLDQLTLVDVREAAELARTGRAAGAIHVPLDLVPLRCDPRAGGLPAGLDVNRPVAVYCASGARSAMAAQKLREFGFRTVHNLGGLGDWIAAGGATER